jgi:hypothetical protein
MDTSVRISKILEVTLRAEDIDASNQEVIPNEHAITVHQIILHEAQQDSRNLKVYVCISVIPIITYNPLNHLHIPSVPFVAAADADADADADFAQ